MAGTFLMRPSGDMNIPFLAAWLLFVFADALLLDKLLFGFEVFVDVLVELALNPAVDKFELDRLFEEFCVKLVSLEFCF